MALDICSRYLQACEYSKSSFFRDKCASCSTSLLASCEFSSAILSNSLCLVVRLRLRGSHLGGVKEPLPLCMLSSFSNSTLFSK